MLLQEHKAQFVESSPLNQEPQPTKKMVKHKDG